MIDYSLLKKQWGDDSFTKVKYRHVYVKPRPDLTEIALRDAVISAMWAESGNTWSQALIQTLRRCVHWSLGWAWIKGQQACYDSEQCGWGCWRPGCSQKILKISFTHGQGHKTWSHEVGWCDQGRWSQIFCCGTPEGERLKGKKKKDIRRWEFENMTAKTSKCKK